VYFVFSRRDGGSEEAGEVLAEDSSETRTVESENAADALTDEASEKGLRYPAAYFDELVAPDETPMAGEDTQ
jgi:hypothetical protein